MACTPHAAPRRSNASCRSSLQTEDWSFRTVQVTCNCMSNWDVTNWLLHARTHTYTRRLEHHDYCNNNYNYLPRSLFISAIMKKCQVLINAIVKWYKSIDVQFSSSSGNDRRYLIRMDAMNDVGWLILIMSPLALHGEAVFYENGCSDRLWLPSSYPGPPSETW